ncbi:hypothetical protein [Halorubrum sp. HHNYT27]|uniref:DUF7857 domain-containing protein n=1 Tax=Halorubrum sp. HHNYT27 TaxID=3402275 RepID=UPI003EBC34CF
MDLSWTVDQAGDVSLVRCRVHNDEAVSRRVRIESRFDAPVLPPRRAGVPEDGWDPSGVTLRVDPDERRAFGFAAPSEPTDPPVTVESVEPVDREESARGASGPARDGEPVDPTAADALRELGDHRPPRAAIGGSHEPGERRAVEGGHEADDRRDGERSVSGAADSEERHQDVGTDSEEAERAVPDAVDEWFTAVDARIGRAERLTDAGVETATTVVADAGGVDALVDLDERVAGDAERLRAVSERAASLAERAASTDVPVEALERLA